MEAQAYENTTVSDLAHTIRKFIDDNRRAFAVEDRWLADYLQPAWKVATQVMNNRLDEENRKDVQAFRAVELEKEIEAKRSETAKLEAELKKVRAA